MVMRTLFLLIGIIILALFFVIIYTNFVVDYEGFVDSPSKKMAKLPKSVGPSNIPNTMPGAVTRNPINELASYKDIASLIDTIKLYNELYDKFILNIYKRSDFQNLRSKSIPYLMKLQAQLDTGKIVDSLKFITGETLLYNNAIKSIKLNEISYTDINKKTAKSVTKSMIKGNGYASLKDLEYAIERAKNEQKRIDNLRSESSDFKQRSLILEKIQIDFKQIQIKVKKGDMKESAIPINKDDLRNFLINVENPTSKLTPLPKLKPAENKVRTRNINEGFANMVDEAEVVKSDEDKNTEVQDLTDEDSSDILANNSLENVSFISSLKSTTDDSFSNYTNNYIHDSEERDEEFNGTQPIENIPKKIKIPKEYRNLLNDIRSSTRDLNWEMSIDVGYDPNVTIQRRITERLIKISNDIESGQLNKDELKSKFLELDILKQQLKSYNSRKLTVAKNIPDTINSSKSYASANLSDNKLLSPDIIKDLNKKKTNIKNVSNKDLVKSTVVLPNKNPQPSNDYKIRPGFEMTDEDIKNRASLASFDPALVGTLDYKKTVRFLCSQIKDSGLGEPSDFGCIQNPETDVGPDYSWKGNYKMVCSRLGNTWGDWYPEMFGCPKTDTSIIQSPKINATCSSTSLPTIESPKKPCM